jgi:hypothetical protein
MLFSAMITQGKGTKRDVTYKDAKSDLRATFVAAVFVCGSLGWVVGIVGRLVWELPWLESVSQKHPKFWSWVLVEVEVKCGEELESTTQVLKVGFVTIGEAVYLRRAPHQRRCSLAHCSYSDPRSKWRVSDVEIV